MNTAVAAPDRRRRRIVWILLALLVALGAGLWVDSDRLAHLRRDADDAWNATYRSYLDRQGLVPDLLELVQSVTPSQDGAVNGVMDAFQELLTKVPLELEAGPLQAEYEGREVAFAAAFEAALTGLAADPAIAGLPEFAEIRAALTAANLDIAAKRTALFAAIDRYNAALDGVPSTLWVWASNHQAILEMRPENGPLTQP